MKTAIWWVRRDLRLMDNQALSSALEAAGQVLPVFIRDPVLINSPWTAEKRLAFLNAGLRELDASLQIRGSHLLMRSGKPSEELERLATESGAEAIFAEPDNSPYARKRDDEVAARLPVVWVGNPAVRPPGSVEKSDGGPYTVFTPFSRTWKALPSPGPELPAPQKISSPVQLQSEPIPSALAYTADAMFPAGELEAQRRLAAFTTGSNPPIYRYADRRNRLDLDGTSSLSPYLRFGMLSARQATRAAIHSIEETPDLGALHAAETWLNELIWRDFYIHILYYFPHARDQNFRLKNIAWENDPQKFEAWCEGQTGYPAVDAAMRQLFLIGWIHNRSRMIVASFLTKDLLVDWRWGERWFMQHLLDGDPAANSGGWQWIAGTGTDAAPYFRIFNPVSQGERADPVGDYIRRWLPELDKVPDRYIHQPWTMPDELQKATGCIIGRDYPFPMINHAWARKRALNILIRGNSRKMNREAKS